MTGDPIASVGRARRRLAALGVDPDSEAAARPACVLCGESRLFTLNARDGHHVAGRVNDPALTATVCLNCHAEQTERHRQVGVRLRDLPATPPTMLDRLTALLAGLGVFLVEAGSRLVEWADYLRRMITVLDRDVAGWRAAVSGVPGPRGVLVPVGAPPACGGVPAFPAGDRELDEDRGTYDH